MSSSVLLGRVMAGRFRWSFDLQLRSPLGKVGGVAVSGLSWHVDNLALSGSA